MRPLLLDLVSLGIVGVVAIGALCVAYRAQRSADRQATRGDRAVEDAAALRAQLEHRPPPPRWGPPRWPPLPDATVEFAQQQQQQRQQRQPYRGDVT